MCVHELSGVFDWSVTVLKLFRVDSQLQQGAVLRPTLLKNHSITNHTMIIIRPWGRSIVSDDCRTTHPIA